MVRLLLSVLLLSICIVSTSAYDAATTDVKVDWAVNAVGPWYDSRGPTTTDNCLGVTGVNFTSAAADEYDLVNTFESVMIKYTTKTSQNGQQVLSGAANTIKVIGKYNPDTLYAYAELNLVVENINYHLQFFADCNPDEITGSLSIVQPNGGQYCQSTFSRSGNIGFKFVDRGCRPSGRLGYRRAQQQQQQAAFSTLSNLPTSAQGWEIAIVVFVAVGQVGTVVLLAAIAFFFKKGYASGLRQPLNA
jgi:hypothetical protein